MKRGTFIATAPFLLAVSSAMPSLAATIYLNDFGTTAITGSSYTGSPTLATGITSSAFTTSYVNGFGSNTGRAGQGLALNSSAGTPTITLTLNLASGYTLSLDGFSFWDKRSSTGATTDQLKVNGTSVGNALTVPTTGASTGNQTISVNNLTNTVTIIQALSGASGSGSFTFDDFSLTGTLVAPAAPVTNNAIITASPNPLNVNPTNSNRIISGGSAALTLTKTGTDTGTYSATPSAGSGFTATPGSGSIAGTSGTTASVGVGVGTTLGARTGTVTIHNTNTDTPANGGGSADPDDVVTVNATVVQNRQLGEPGATSSPTSVIALGKVLAGATVSGAGTVYTIGSDDTNTRVTLKGGVTGSFTNTATTGNGPNTVTLSTGPSDTAFTAANSTAAVTGTGNFSTAGTKVTYLTIGGSGVDVANSIVGEGLNGEAVKSGRVYVTAASYLASNGSFLSGSDLDTGSIDFGVVNQGDTASQSINIYNVLGSLANFTAGLDLNGATLTSTGANPFSLSIVNGHLVADGADGTNNFATEIATLNTSTAGIYDSIYKLNLADASDIQGGTANQQALTLELRGTVLAIPEPASLSLLAAGGLTLMRRRRPA